MKASTHTEIYRRFEGTLRSHPLRFLTISWSGIKLSFKKKLPLLLLFGPPAMASVIFSFFVHVRYAAEKGEVPGIGAAEMQIALTMAGTNLEVSQLIVQFLTFPLVRAFALLTITWFGAGLIAEDRRLGAHLLYFSRPITRLDYLLGKFFAAAFYGACAYFTPALVINLVAAFSSPSWSFVTQQWDVILKTFGYCALWIFTVTGIVLCVSSLVERKTLALAGVFGAVFLTEAVSNVLAELTDEHKYRLLSLFMNFERIADWAFDREDAWQWSPEASLSAIAVILVSTVLILALRLRRMEVVA